MDYVSNKKMNFGDAADFQDAVNRYYDGLAGVAEYSQSAFEGLDNDVINNKSVNNKNTLLASDFYIKKYNADLIDVIKQGGRTGVDIAAMGLFPDVGPAPRGTMINSSTQQSIVESKAGLNFTNTTIKRFLERARRIRL